MAIKIGRYNQQITINRPTVIATSDRGTATKSNVLVATVWASIKQTAANENELQRQPVANRTYEIRIRYLTGLLETDEISWGSKTLQIESIDDNFEQRSEETVLICREQI